jgi:hypothetical protein
MEKLAISHFNSMAEISGRISEIVEVENSWTWAHFWGYIDRVYMLIVKMQPGTQIIIAQWASPENIELFTLIVKLFVFENNDPRVLLSDDYTTIIKTQ